MAFKKLSLESLLSMDGGRIRETFDQELSRIEHDLADRPAVKTARKVTLTFTVAPVADEEGDLDGAACTYDVKATMPKRQSRQYDLTTRKDGSLYFNEFAPENAEQMTIDEVGSPANARREVANAR